MSSSNIFAQINSKITSASTTAVIAHIKPDGDALGSALAVKMYFDLLAGKKECDVLCDDFLPQKYAFLTGYSNIKREADLTQYDLAICVDCSDLNRIGSYKTAVAKHKNVINIDHHISNENYAGINCVDTASSSTCEIIYSFLKHSGAVLTKQIAECIYCGLSSDTGNFSHSNTNSQSFMTAAELTEIIGDISYINQLINKEMPLCRLKLLSAAASRLKLFVDNTVALLYVTLGDLQRHECEAYETEGLVDYAINLKGVEVGIMILQSSHNAFKVSFRSKKTDVCKIAADFGGGGHIHASGCMLFGDLETVIDKIIKTVEFYTAP